MFSYNLKIILNLDIMECTLLYEYFVLYVRYMCAKKEIYH